MIWKVVQLIIEQYNVKNLEITNLRLQKILYFIQERAAKELGEIVFKEEMQAWTFGPVFPDVYNVYSAYGRDNISNVLYDSNEIVPIDIMKIVDEEITRTQSILNTWSLVKESHEQGKVWYDITDGGTNINYQNIPVNLLLEAEK